MEKQLKKSLIIIGSSTAIGFLGDVIMYSLAQSKGGPIKIHFPKGKALFQVILVGFLTGVIVDYAVNRIVESQKSEAEKELDKLSKRDIAAIESGNLKATTPVRIEWM
ncbi:MAG: hypothetical protein EXR21_09085 [Flavobacteriaceae bacterium]|nr:hypothetical protein [Flavobacteriaceae bacterium]